MPLTAFANEQITPGSASAVPSPATDLWRAVRQRDMQTQAQTQIRGIESSVLINRSGEDFRQYRRRDFIGPAGWVIVGVAAAIAVFYLIRGGIPIPSGRSGKRVRRFSNFDRTLHWFTASLFIILAVTGLTLLFGRFVLIPILGPDAFGAVAGFFKDTHNLLGPLFIVAVILLFIRFAIKNLPARGDIMWLLKGGGIIGNAHATAGFFNAGEKIWFWLVMLLGTVVSVTGVILLFPTFGQGREIMQLALIVHGIASVLFIAGSFGHIYIGTLGTEGSLESMTTGYVDTNWAKAHHDRWFDEVKDTASPAPDKSAQSADLSPNAHKA